MPVDATSAEHDQIVKNHKQVLEVTGLVPMATINLLFDPIFIDGASTSNDKAVHQSALLKTMHTINLGVELGAGIGNAND